MNVRELITILEGLDPDMEVVTRYPHCCGRHYYGLGSDTIHFKGATEDAWWVPEVREITIAGWDTEAKVCTAPYPAIGVGFWDYDPDELATTRRHEVEQVGEE